MANYGEIRVNFGWNLLQRLTGWSEDEMESREGELDFFLGQEMVNEFGDEAEQVHGTAFYAQDKDYLVDAYNEDGDPAEVDQSRLEKVARSAIECIKMAA